MKRVACGKKRYSVAVALLPANCVVDLIANPDLSNCSSRTCGTFALYSWPVLLAAFASASAPSPVATDNARPACGNCVSLVTICTVGPEDEAAASSASTDTLPKRPHNLLCRARCGSPRSKSCRSPDCEASYSYGSCSPTNIPSHLKCAIELTNVLRRISL